MTFAEIREIIAKIRAEKNDDDKLTVAEGLEIAAFIGRKVVDDIEDENTQRLVTSACNILEAIVVYLGESLDD